MSKNHDINDEEESESDEEELRTMMSTRSHITKSRSDHIKGDSASIRKQRKIEMLFQNKMLICPQQVLRYAYGGIPLSTSHNESQIYPPKCSGCNESRVFEMQLMPTILEFLVDVIPKKKSNECDTKNDNLTIDDYEEIYFGVVTIWSCPNSCQQSYEEVAIVQSPLDE